MENTSIIALSRQSVIRREIDVIANNIANMNTTGFKGEKMMFVEHVVRSKGGDKIGGERHSYVRDIATARDLSEGPLQQTGNPLDLAISENGYFVIGTEAGERYSRSGNFQLDQDGQLVTNLGDPVLSQDGAPFFFSPEDKDITIAKDGTISTENGALGRLGIVTFQNPHELKIVSGGLYSSTQPAQPVEAPVVLQGMLENSNVQPIIEMTRMIEAHRSYSRIKDFIEKEDGRIKKMMEAFGQRV